MDFNNTTVDNLRQGLQPMLAFDEIKNWAGRQFDEEIVDAFVAAFENGKIEGISDETAKF